MQISRKSAIAILLVFPFLEPDSFRVIHSLHMFLRVWGAVSFAILLLYFVARKDRKKSSIIWLLLIYCMCLLYASTTGLGSLTTTITQLLPIIGICLWTDYYIADLKTFSAVIKLIMFYIYVNLATLICFPNGLYVSQSYQATPYICYFLGYRNVQSLWLLPALALVLWENFCYSDKLTRRNKVRLAVIVLTIILTKSSTTYVAAAGFVIFFVFLIRTSANRYLWGIINIRNTYIAYIALTIGLVFFNIQYNFAFIIENILHKDLDLTDRIYVWQKVIVYVNNQFITGYGYIYDPTSRALIGASHPHNYLLNLMYTGGIIGTLLITVVFIVVSKKSVRYMSSLAVRAVFLGVVVLLLIGLTEPLKQLPTIYILLTMLYHSDIFAKKGQEGIEKYDWDCDSV